MHRRRVQCRLRLRPPERRGHEADRPCPCVPPRADRAAPARWAPRLAAPTRRVVLKSAALRYDHPVAPHHRPLSCVITQPRPIAEVAPLVQHRRYRVAKYWVPQDLYCTNALRGRERAVRTSIETMRLSRAPWPCDLMTGIAVGLVRNLIRARAASSAFEFALTAGVGHHHAADKQRESARPNSLDWAERAPRFSPIDRLAYATPHAIAHFARGRYEQSASAARSNGRCQGRCQAGTGAATVLQRG